MAKTTSKTTKKHKSFRRSYREDYLRELKMPGVGQHIFITFKMIFKNWKLFLPFLVLMAVATIALVGATSEETYRGLQNTIEQAGIKTGAGDIGTFAKSGLILISVITSGSFAGASGETLVVFGTLMFLIVWLVTIFIVRHRLAGHNIKLRDALYNATTPLVSSFVILLVALVECIPIMVFLMALSAAIQTEFLAMPFYALLFFVFSALMIMLSAYLLSSSLIALIAVSAPGLYPVRALKTASDLMAGRRIRFILRVVALIIVTIIMWVVVMMPLIMFDLVVKNLEWTAGIPFIPVCMIIMAYFIMIYSTVYLYLYYRWLLKN